jgi:two-component system, OmpR family, sensor histidine kinase ArlS
MSIRYKIALLFSIFVTLIISIVSLMVYYFSATERLNTFRLRLKNRALSTAKVYSSITDHNYSLLRKMDTVGVASLFYKSICIMDGQEHYVYHFSDDSQDSLILSTKTLDKAMNDGEYFFSFHDKKAVAVYQNENNKKFWVAVAAGDLEGMSFLSQLKNILWIAMFLSTGISFLVGLLFAKNLINPLARITNAVNLISTNNLSQRIHSGNAKDELNKLVQTFNNLLDRLQGSFATQRRFISNASHELSTPLTSISSQLEVAMQKKRGPEEYLEVMKSVHEDIQELQQLTRSLLDIAKAGTHGSIDLSEVRLDELLLKVASDVQKQHQQYKAQIRFEVFPEDEKMLSVFGNNDLLYIAFKNMVENGCKYSDNQESIIHVSFVGENKITTLVTNKGDVIAESDIQNIFQPFFRSSNVQHKQGFGLGLTLSKRIISLHKGSIEVQSDLSAGTIFTIILPNVFSNQSPTTS